MIQRTMGPMESLNVSRRHQVHGLHTIIYQWTRLELVLTHFCEAKVNFNADRQRR